MSEFSFWDNLKQKLHMKKRKEVDKETYEIPKDKNLLIAVRNLKKHFLVAGGGIVFNRTPIFLKAVDGISFDIKKGETVGIVGESGCGKSTAARALLQLLEPTAGHVFFKKESGEIVDLVNANKTELREIRRQMQIVFQDPSA